MLHAGLGEEDLKGFYLIWHGSHIGQATKLIFINFHVLVPKNCHMKFGYKWLSSF